MIIEVDFCDHWKVESLVSQCGESAVRCLLRLWSFCQMRKTDVISSAQLEAIAKWKGEKGQLFDALSAVELIELAEDSNDKYVRMHDFAEVNAKIYSRWQNGRNGGRNANRTETEQQPNDNRTETENKTEQQPNDNRTETECTPIDKIDKIDKIERKSKKKETSAGLCAEKFNQALDKAVESKQLSPQDCFAITKKFLEWATYRFEVKHSPFQPSTAEQHARRVIDCIVNHKLEAMHIVEFFNKSMEHEWDGWFFNEELLKVKALIEKNNSTKTPPSDAPIGVPAGALDYNMQ